MKYALSFLAGALAAVAAIFGFGWQPDGSAAPAGAAAAGDDELARLRLAEVMQKEEITRLKFELTAARANSSSLEEQIAKQEGAAGAAGDKPASPMSQIATMMENPAMRDMIASQQSRAMEMLYGDLMKKFEFTPEEREHFLKLLTERQMLQTEIGLKAMTGDFTAEQREALGQTIQDSIAASDAKIKEFLNDEADYAAFKTYTDQQPERQQMDLLRPAMARAGQALSDEQGEALVNLMFEERNNFKFTTDLNDPAQAAASFPTLDEAATAKLIEEQGQLQARIAARAAQVLNPQQLEAFRQSQESNLQMMKAAMEMARAMAGPPQN